MLLLKSNHLHINGNKKTVITNSRGIYAFTGLMPDTNYRINANKAGYDFGQINVNTGISYDGATVTGNKWGIDLTGFSNCINVTIGTGTSQWEYPMNTYYHDSRTQVIYLADEIGSGGAITELAFNVSKAPSDPMENWTIRMKHTTMSEYNSSSLDAAGWTIVYQHDELVDTGWYTFEFQTPFDYNGTDNLLVDFSYNNSSYTESSPCIASNTGQKRSAHACSDSRHEDPLSWSSTTSPKINLSNNIPNLKFLIGRDSQTIGGNTKLLASDGAAEDQFGNSVSIS